MMSYVVKGASYEPWVRSNSDIRPKCHFQPPGLSSCFDLNQLDSDGSLPTCCACTNFLQDKVNYAHLRNLESNREAPYRYRCDTPWQKATANKRPGPLPSTLPPKKQRPIVLDPSPLTTPLASPPHSPLVSPIATTPNKTPPLFCPGELQPKGLKDLLTAYLMRHLACQDKLVDQLEQE
jgi:hypothetical protein